MDSKDVNKAITKRIKPMLKEAGFARSTARTFWRHKEDRIEVVNFQSFNSYLADGVGCTTFSFAVNLGIFFLCIPAQFVKEKNGILLPEEFACHFRRRLFKTIKQPQLPRRDTWYVSVDGSDLEAVIQDARNAIEEVGLAWFDRYADMHEVLRTLLEDDEANEGTWGFGRNPSPMRSYQTGYVAKHLSEWDVAARAFKKVIDGGIMDDSHVQSDYANVLARCERPLR